VVAPPKKENPERRMSKARIYARNLAANWIGYGANLAVMFFLSPFVVHTLGDVRYGVWSLIMSLTGYLGLVELGTRGGLGRFINFYLGKEDVPRVNGIINTAMAMFAGAGVLLTGAAVVLAVFFGTFFPKVPDTLVPRAQWVIVIVAANVWLGFPGASFRQVLAAFDRFDLSNVVDIGVLAIRTGGTVAVLLYGGGLLELAIVQTASSAAGVVGAYGLSKRIFPDLRLRPALASAGHFRELFGFSIWAFVGSIAYRLLYTTDSIVIAALIGPKHVTFYAIGGMLIMRMREVLRKATSVLSPQMIKDCARKDYWSLKNLFGKGTTLSMAVSIPILVGFIFFGREFLILWMGPKYEVSYPILLILTLSTFPAVAFVMGSPVYAGFHKVRLAALITFLQGVLNLGLSLAFVMVWKMGIVGVAWGTFYPRVTITLFGAYYALRFARISLGRFLLEEGWRWLLAIGLFSGICWAGASLPVESTWATFFLRVGGVMVPYPPIAWAVLLRKEDKKRLVDYLAARLPWRRKAATGTSLHATNDG